ncbi:MAG: hypothetical protein WCK35_27730 [Chloroflexota bacterium]
MFSATWQSSLKSAPPIMFLGTAALVLWRRGNPQFCEKIATLAEERLLAMTDLGNG